jgi:hypothetical protein
MQRDHELNADLQQTATKEPHKEPEVAELSPDRGEEVEVGAGDRSRFFSVANSLLAALHPDSPELALPENLPRRETEAIKLIFEARSARQTEVGAGHISALERSRYLQLGIASLQRVLAMARNPRFPQGRPHIEEIRKRLARLKEELQQQILVEEGNRRRPDKKPPDKKQDEEAEEKAEAEATAGTETKNKKKSLSGT